MPREHERLRVEEDLYEWQLLDRIDRLNRWRGSLREFRDCENHNNATEEQIRYAPILLTYVDDLWHISRNALQVLMNAEFSSFSEIELKETLRDWISSDRGSAEYRKAELYLPGQGTEFLNSEIETVRSRIAEYVPDVVKGLWAFGRRPGFEFWPTNSDAEIQTMLGSSTKAGVPFDCTEDPGLASKRIGGRGVPQDGTYRALIRGKIGNIKAKKIRPTWENVAASIVVDTDDRLSLPPDLQRSVKDLRFAGNLLEFFNPTETLRDTAAKKGVPLQKFKARFKNRFSAAMIELGLRPRRKR